MPGDVKPIHELHLKYILGEELDPSETAQFQEWRTRSGYHAALLEQFRKKEWVVQQLEIMHEAPIDRIWDKIQATTHAERVRRMTKRITAIAAASILFLYIGRKFIYSNTHPTSVVIQQPAVLRPPVITHTVPPAVEITKTTQGKEFLKIPLSDGSKVSLSNASSLQYPIAFPGTTRSVILDGRAYFDVTATSNNPFIVFVHGKKIEALGTRFLISAYRDEPDIQITLFKGVVRVTTSKTSLLLKPGEQARIIKDGIEKTAAPDSSDLMAWNEDNPKFSFNETSLTTALRDIARWYEVGIKNTQRLKGKPVTGRITMKAPLDSTLKRIGLTEGDSIYLHKKGKTIVVSGIPPASSQ